MRSDVPTPKPQPTQKVGCADLQEYPEQSGSHLIGSAQPPQPYNSVPPTSGWHTTGVEIAVHDVPLKESEQVSVLEVGGIVVSHGRLQPKDLARLHDRVERKHDGVVAVTPYRKLKPRVVAFTAWTISQECVGLDLKALDAFVREHAEAHSEH